MSNDSEVLDVLPRGGGEQLRLYRIGDELVLGRFIEVSPGDWVASSHVAMSFTEAEVIIKDLEDQYYRARPAALAS